MDNFIKIYHKAFDETFCNKIIECFNIAEENGLTRNRQQHEGEETLKVYKDDSSMFIPSFPLEHMTQGLLDSFNKVFWGQCYKHYAEKYSILNTCSQHNIYTIKVQKTRPGEGYHIWHPEITGRNSGHRLLVWTAYMNDNFEAGETEFLYQQYRYKPNKGDVLIFPAGFTHTHRGNPPIGGDKYIITGWVEY